MLDKSDGPWMGIKMISGFQAVDIIAFPFTDENDLRRSLIWLGRTERNVFVFAGAKSLRGDLDGTYKWEV